VTGLQPSSTAGRWPGRAGLPRAGCGARPGDL